MLGACSRLRWRVAVIAFCPATPLRGRFALLVVLAMLLASLQGCRSTAFRTTVPEAPEQAWTSARQWEVKATRNGTARAWLQCAADAYLALEDARLRQAASDLARRCTNQYMQGVSRLPEQLDPNGIPLGGAQVVVETRGLSPNLIPPISVHAEPSRPPLCSVGRPTLGVPVVLTSKRCSGEPRCQLLPPEGIFRGGTVWVERSLDGGVPRLVVAGEQVAVADVAGVAYDLHHDAGAPYSRGVRVSKLNRLGVWGLIGGREVGRRAGVYLLEDYDPAKRPLVMIHGLGSSPLIWEKLSNAVWSSPELRARYQVWHVVYQTDAPLLVQRRRVQRYLDQAWQLLDPEGDDPARTHIVLVGHSLGGVIARMLSVDSGDGLWNAAFLVPPAELVASDEERDLLNGVFHFPRYPGVKRAIFIASPHRGSPNAIRWFGRLARALVGKRNTEVTALLKIVRRNPDAIQPGLREAYLKGRINSISTLQPTQPVSAAGQALAPGPDIRFHTIAGVKSSLRQTDGVVPLDSASLSGAESTLIVQSGHNVHEHPQAIVEVLRILREDAQQ